MVELKKMMKAINVPSDDPDRVHVRPDYTVTCRDGTFFARSRSGNEEEITLGDLMTAAEWDISYELGEGVPRIVQKHYALEQARYFVQQVANFQIATDEKHNTHLSLEKRRDYGKVASRMMKKGPKPTGIDAEKLLKTYLKKLSWDSDLGFTIEDADTHEDMERATDFYVRMKGPGGTRIPVQFTTTADERVLQRKKETIERLHNEAGLDIKLAIAELPPPRNVMSRWFKLPHHMRGPMQILKPGRKEHLCDEVLRQVLPIDAHEAAMAKIRVAIQEDDVRERAARAAGNTWNKAKR